MGKPKRKDHFFSAEVAKARKFVTEGAMEEVKHIGTIDFNKMDSESQSFLGRTHAVLEAIDQWGRSGRVVVSCDESLAMLLACTPIGQLEYEDMVSPYGCHATLFEKSMTMTMSKEEFDHSGELIATKVDWAIMGINQKTESISIGRTDSGDEIVFQKYNARTEEEFILAMIGPHPILPGNSYSGFVANADTMNALLQENPAARVIVGLNRLISSCPPRERVSVIDDIEVRTIMPSRPRQCRQVVVRNLSIIEPHVLDACRRVIAGERSPTTLRHIRRGHWRNQAFGPRHSLRRMQWIRPQWIGPLAGKVPDTIVRVR